MSHSTNVISTRWIRETAWELLRRTGHLWGLARGAGVCVCRDETEAWRLQTDRASLGQRRCAASMSRPQFHCRITQRLTWTEVNQGPLSIKAAKWLNTLGQQNKRKKRFFLMFQWNGWPLLASRMYWLERQTRSLLVYSTHRCAESGTERRNKRRAETEACAYRQIGRGLGQSIYRLFCL